MKKSFIGLLVSLLVTTPVFATSGTDKQIDSIQNSSGGSALAVPSVGSTFVTDSNTLTLSNKTLSGATLTGTTTAAAINASGAVHLTGSSTALTVDHDALISGALTVSGAVTLTTTLTVAQGGTGATSLTAHAVLIGEGTSAVTIASPVQFQALIGNAGGSDPSFQALPLNQSAAITGSLGVANGGTGASSLTAHDVVVGNGTSAVTLISPSTAGFVLTSNGTSADPTFQAVPATSPTINNSAASPQSVDPAVGVALSTPTYSNVVFVKGNAASSTVLVTATPSITACTSAGQIVRIVSESATDKLTLQNDSDLNGSQLLLNGPWTSGSNSGTPNTLTLMCDGAGTPMWVEMARQQ